MRIDTSTNVIGIPVSEWKHRTTHEVYSSLKNHIIPVFWLQTEQIGLVRIKGSRKVKKKTSVVIICNSRTNRDNLYKTNYRTILKSKNDNQETRNKDSDSSKSKWRLESIVIRILQ